jgi:deazaflavin-dependent oxidoreductase (nitroreductase family)
MPSDSVLKVMNGAHRVIMKVTGGRLGWSAGSMPVVELTTTGAKSGLPRTVLLTSPVQEGDAYVVVASRGGDDHHPAWFHNLKAHPEVQVSIKGAVAQPMQARVASSEERARLWPQVETTYKGYAGYQRKTEREIPLVFLEPIG